MQKNHEKGEFLLQITFLGGESMTQKSLIIIVMVMSVLFAVTGFANPGKPSF
ncbi:MAG: hypothetical protein PVG96_10525 [Desulfobacterales bacterium]